MKHCNRHPIAATVLAGSLLLAASAAIGQGTAPARPAPAPAAPTAAPGTVPATPNAVPGMTNPVPAMPANPPGSIANPVPPMNPQPSTAAPTLQSSQPLNPQAGTAGMRTPSRSDSAATAFHSLDPANRGYVTKAETDQIPGFTGFDNADVNRDGHLSPEEFATAWKFYGGQ